MGTYITITDITNKLFSRLGDASKQVYVDKANIEIEDFSLRLGIPVADIVTPVHEKIIRYGTLYALSLFAEDNIGFNNSKGTSEGDVYDELFKRTRYLIQNVKPEIVAVMFNGETQTPDNRAVRSIRLVRG